MSKRIKPPNKESLATKQYQYLNLPKGMDDCYYDLELTEFKKTENEDKYVAVFKVLDTNTKVKVGSKVSHLMDPYQKFAETYFWRDIFSIYCVCRGREPDKEAMDKLAGKHKKVLAKLEDGAGIGGCCNVAIRSYEKDDKVRTQMTWSSLQAE